MLLRDVNPEKIKSFFPINFYLKGQDYFKEGRVKDLQVLHKGHNQEKITATVTGEKTYNVNIDLTGPASKIFLRGTCSCPMSINCKHVVATLLTAMQQPVTAAPTRALPLPTLPSIRTPDPKIDYWLKDLQELLGAEKTTTSLDLDETHSLFYLLSLNTGYKPCLKVQLSLVKKLKSGLWGAAKKFSATSSSHQNHLHPIDRELLVKLELANKLARNLTHFTDYVLSGELGEQLLPELIATGRCCWGSEKNAPLTLVAPISAELDWKVDEQGYQIPSFNLTSTPPLELFFVDQLWYYNTPANTLGLLETGIEKELLQLILAAPALPPERTQDVAQLLTKRNTTIKPPQVFTKKKVLHIKPIPCLKLQQTLITKPGGYKSYWQPISAMEPIALLSFDYQGHKIAWDDPNESVSHIEGNQLTELLRDPDFEEAALDELEVQGLSLIDDLFELDALNPEQPNFFLVDNDECDPLEFSRSALPVLRKQGWQIEIAPDYPYQIVNEGIEEWYSSIEESSNYDWFGLELGITVQGEKINLLPILQKLIQKLQTDKKTDLQETESFIVQLPDGRYIELPATRVRNILNVLIELYDDNGLTDNKTLQFSKLQATRLQELEAAMGATQLRWLGGEKLRALGKKLLDFKGITSVQPPAEFQGELRPYQQEGLSWLQFLCEYELSGILADDMGLGKTVQALAHLSVEKVQGRMNMPSLVVAPTSLMFNWQMEAARFSPHLNVLLLHGSGRKHLFADIAKHDLILTTYPLLVRDKEILLKQNFHLLILDEAQFIKNSKNIATQVALQLKAKHRLCLTGTPIENHLGELWSLFHFMMPGLLGDEKKFNRLFRTPIEKFSDQDRRLALNKRVAPFLLRRTKDKVVQELPAKIEIIRQVELEGGQRDLYETIRMTMQKRIRDEIAKLGLARSHIIILDALLKLRQVCCDPRLLKMAVPQHKKEKSAKLDLLMSLLPELLEEGRRILLFSQFTEMLGLIEKELHYRKIPFVKLTGQTKDRATPVRQFQAGQVPLFLISLKAGGTGLNLTAADVVIHYDPWWNPAVENQATDRAHRIGQDKTVFVYKFITKETVEEKILEMQKHKHALMEGLFSENPTGKLKMTEKDLEGLFDPF